MVRSFSAVMCLKDVDRMANSADRDQWDLGLHSWLRHLCISVSVYRILNKKFWGGRGGEGLSAPFRP